MNIDDEQFQKESDEVSALVDENIIPILLEIDEEYPNQSAFFTTFITTMHFCFAEGWTKEDLLREVTDHHAVFLKNEMPDDGEHIH